MPQREASTEMESFRSYTLEPSQNKKSFGEDNDDLTAFWRSLPQPKALRTKGLERIKERRSNLNVMQSMSEMIKTSMEVETLVEKQQKAILLANLPPKRRSILDSQRFMGLGANGTSSINADLDDYLSSTPKNWSAEWKELNSDLQKKIQQRTLRLRVGVPVRRVGKAYTITKKVEAVPPPLSRGEESFHQQICREAMAHTISPQRKKEIKAEIRDMDLWNRPSHYIKLPKTTAADPMLKETESVGTIYDGVKAKISLDALDILIKAAEADDFIAATQDSFKIPDYAGNTEVANAKGKDPASLKDDDQKSMASSKSTFSFDFTLAETEHPERISKTTVKDFGLDRLAEKDEELLLSYGRTFLNSPSNGNTPRKSSIFSIKTK